MWRSRLVGFLVVAGIFLTGFAAWYESGHRTHTTGYSPVISIATLVGIGVIEVIKFARDSARDKGRLSGRDFLEEYTTLLTNAIAALQDIHDYNEPQLLQTQTKILKLIAAVVVLFHPEVTNLGINANIMLNEEVALHSNGEKFADYVKFWDPKRSANTYKSVLCIKAWADPPQIAPENFSLPVDSDERRILFGAPRTFLSGRETVIANIHNKKEMSKMLNGQPDDVRDAVEAFFKSQKYKTFMSISVKNSDKIVAVLNIQADQLKVFGNSVKQSEIKKFIDPFCTILGIMAAQSLNSRPAPGP